MTPQGIPLGLLHQDSWSRADSLPGTTFPTSKESDKWLSALRAVEGTLTPPQKALVIQDREADVYAFLSAPRREGVDLLVRATKARPLQARVLAPDVTGTPAEPETLMSAVANAPVVGHKTVAIRALNPADAGREANLTVRCMRAHVVAPSPPHRKEKRQPATLQNASLSLSVIQACEETPPPGVKEPIRWVLLTSLEPPPGDREAPAFALRMVEFYALRWRIERFHFVLKSGCRFERLQVDDFSALQKALSLYSVVAWRLMYLMYSTRDAPDTPAEDAVSEVERQVLERATGQPIRTARDALLAVARVGGFRAVPSAPEPGLQSLWLGFRQLEAMVAGFLLARNQPPN